MMIKIIKIATNNNNKMITIMIYERLVLYSPNVPSSLPHLVFFLFFFF